MCCGGQVVPANGHWGHSHVLHTPQPSKSHSSRGLCYLGCPSVFLGHPRLPLDMAHFFFLSHCRFLCVHFPFCPLSLYPMSFFPFPLSYVALFLSLDLRFSVSFLPMSVLFVSNATFFFGGGEGGGSARVLPGRTLQCPLISLSGSCYSHSVFVPLLFPSVFLRFVPRYSLSLLVSVSPFITISFMYDY